VELKSSLPIWPIVMPSLVSLPMLLFWGKKGFFRIELTLLFLFIIAISLGLPSVTRFALHGPFCGDGE